MKRLAMASAVAVLVAACAPQASPPLPAASSAPPATSSPDPATPEASRSGGAMELTASSNPLVPGRYHRSGFAPRITFELTGPWHAVQLYAEFFDVQQDVGTPDVIAVQFTKPDALYGADGAAVALTDPSEAADILRANPGLTVISTAEVDIGGLDGVEVTVENAGAAMVQVMRVPPGPLSILAGRRLRIALFDTPDGLLAIMVGGSVARWDEALRTAQPVLESIEIGE